MSPDSAAICAEWCARLPLDSCGYAEAIDSLWCDVGGKTRTFLAQARLAYVFTHAGARADPKCGAAGAAATALIHRIFWRPDGMGWARAVDGAGRISDDAIDTYDQAFGLLALAWHYRVTGDAKARETARAAAAGLLEAAGVTTRNGFPEQRSASAAIPSAFRRQNPHMHLLEAFLAWHSADVSGCWLELATGIVDLFKERLRDRTDGTLGEYFDEDWRPATGDPGRLREPGHHFEWVWLLRRYSEASGDDSVRDDARDLYTFARESGVDQDGLAFDGVRGDGAVIAGTKLLWPQTEMLKAHLAWYEWTRDSRARELALGTLAGIRDHYMISGSALWHNQLDRARRPLPVPILSRVLYHVFVALTEAERVLACAPV
jgi:mannose/cellobiose epimerase-like protein (N-acyl-D-glucosamine 2-epimerase family)